MHKYILSELNKYELKSIEKPVILNLIMYIPINYGDVSRRSGEIRWNPPTENYIPTADEDNLRVIWEKCIKDCITKVGIWPDDNMYWCRGTNSKIIFIDKLDERKIEIELKELNNNEES